MSEVGQLLLREVELPPDVLVTVKHARVSPDLRYATVIVSVFPDQKAPSTLARLTRALPHFQKLLRGKLAFHHTPRLRFALDRMEQNVTRLAQVLLEEKKKEQQDPAANS